jgi:hypothetical protein
MFGTSHLLASIGGFLSLIAGASLISLFELFYFFGLKNLKRKKANRISNEPDTVNVEKPTNILYTFIENHLKFSTIHGMDNLSEGKVFW